MERKILNEQLGMVNQSLFYLILIILSVFLSFRVELIQREQLEEALAGKPQKAVPDVFPLQFSASVVVAGALGFFFCLSLRVCRDAAQGDDPDLQRSAGMNVWASLLVLAAALIRLYNLGFMEDARRCPPAEGGQPEQAE